MSNASFTAKMSNATGWGDSDELDIYSAPCFGPLNIDGNVRVHMNGRSTGGRDALNLDFSSALTNGSTYDLSFYMATATAFGSPIGGLGVGFSSLANTFEELVFSTTSTVPDTWELFSTSFIAGPDANYLSLRNNQEGWLAVDGFSVTERSGQIPVPATLALFSIGIAGLRWSRHKRH